MDIGKAMLDIRESIGLSRRSAAEALKITPGALWKIENGKTAPKPATIRRFCEELHVPLARLYCKAFTAEDFK